MIDENKQRLQEEREDEALKLLMEEYAQIHGAALWQQFLAAEAAEQGDETPETEDRKSSRGSTEKNRRIDFLKRLGKGLGRAAVVFLVLACLLSPLVISVEAFKIPVINCFVTLKNTFSAFDFGNNTGLSREQEVIMNLIASVPCPDGYSISRQEVTSDGKIWIHFACKGKDTMRISMYPADGQITIDTEDVNQVPMQLHDYEAVYLHKEGHRLMWVDNKRELVLDLRAFELEEDDFWRYAYTLAAKLSQ